METKQSKSVFNSISNGLSMVTGGFYCDKSDKRLFVPKSIPLAGFTMNFGQPLAYVVIVGLILAIVLCAIFLM